MNHMTDIERTMTNKLCALFLQLPTFEQGRLIGQMENEVRHNDKIRKS